jgi:transcriptional regulator with XRE-family HTH domain
VNPPPQIAAKPLREGRRPAGLFRLPLAGLFQKLQPAPPIRLEEAYLTPRNLGPAARRGASKTPARSPSAFDLTVGRNVRIWRMARGLSQGQLAARVGISLQQMQKYESGDNRITPGRISGVARVLGIPVFYLFFGTDGKDAEESSLLELIADHRSFRLASAFAGIKRSQLRMRIVNMVEKIAAVAPRQSEKLRRR